MRHSCPVVVLTGATGFLGGRVLDRLLSRGCRVVTLGRRGAGRPDATWISCDLAVDRVPEIPEGAVVVHLAALMPTHANAHDVDAHIANTAQAANNMLPAVERASTVIVASTTDVYGRLRTVPADESHPTNPETAYGACKLVSEHLFRIACRRAGVPLAVLRLSQVYGPGEPAVKVIPRFIAALHNEASIVVANGGRDTRDYVYLDDAVSAIEAAVDRRADGMFNIAGGREVSILAVATKLAQLHGTPEAVRVEAHVGTTSRGSFDISAARRHLDYQPQVSIDEGLARHYAAAQRAAPRPVAV